MEDLYIETPWSQSNASDGVTSSERYLTKLGRKAFLSLWSYSNLFTDEGKKGNGDGKELCDFTVIFGDHVLLFSDKHCEFPNHSDINVAWYRWYRRAVEKSAKQLAGAESWLKRFPNRLFLDAKCEQRFPLNLPPDASRKVHLIAVTRGSTKAAFDHWGGGSSGSLVIDTSVSLREHEQTPFRVGWTLPDRKFVHIFDEMTLDIVLNELDTVSDFIGYLSKKEKYLTNPDVVYSIAGEEELVASYFMRMDKEGKNYCFPTIAPDINCAMHMEGDWREFVTSEQYKARQKSNAPSYRWDELIEYQNSHIIKGTAQVHFQSGDANQNHELVMRAMAEEGRVARRGLAESLLRVLMVNEPGKRFTRTVVSSARKNRGYVFLSIPNSEDLEYETYREFRRAQLIAYCEACRVEIEGVSEVVGIASEPIGEKLSSQEFILMNFGDEVQSDEDRAKSRAFFREINIWNPDNIRPGNTRDFEFPLAFAFDSYGSKADVPMNRKARRAAAKKQKKRGL